MMNRSTQFLFAVICASSFLTTAQTLPQAASMRNGSFEPAFAFKTIQDPSAVQGTFASAINDRGLIVGSYLDANGAPQGFLYRNGTFTPLAFSPFDATAPAGLNDHGEIVGSYYNIGSIPQGFLYSEGTFSTIEVPFPNMGTYPSGINNQGDIVGTYVDASGILHGF